MVEIRACVYYVHAAESRAGAVFFGPGRLQQRSKKKKAFLRSERASVSPKDDFLDVLKSNATTCAGG